MTLVGSVISNDAVGFSCSCLSICEDGGIDTIEELFDRVLYQMEGIFLCALRRQDVIEFHIGVIAWSSYL